MVLFITMVERIRPNSQGQQDHAHFETCIINDIGAKKRKAAEKQG